MMQHSIMDNNSDVVGGRRESRYVPRNRSGDEMTGNVRDSSAQRGPPVPRTIGSHSQNMSRPNEEESMRRVKHERVASQAAQVAQSLTLQHYKKSSKEGPRPLDVSMHTYFPVALGSQAGSGHSHDQTRRPRPPGMIGTETDESPRDRQRKQKERANRPQPPSRNFTSRDDQGAQGSSLQRRLEMDAGENERRMREKGPSSGMTMKSLESNKSSISRGSAGSRGDMSRGSRSSSVPRQGDGNQDSERPRRQRSSSVSIKTSTQRPPPKLGLEHRPSSRQTTEQVASATRMSRSSGGMPSRQSGEQERSYPSRTHRTSHGDLAEYDDRPALRRIEESFITQVGEDDQGELRRQRQIMMKTTNGHRSQRSLDSGRTLDSHLHREPSDDRLRRKMSVESYERPRRKVSDADSIDRPRRKSSIAEPPQNLRRKNSVSDLADVPRRRISDVDSQDRLSRRKVILTPMTVCDKRVTMANSAGHRGAPRLLREN
jgi:hypothetical protein